MRRHDLLYRLFEEFDTATLRERQRFVDLLPPIDSRMTLGHWQVMNDQLAAQKREIHEAFDAGEILAEIAAHATRDEAFTALDLHEKYGRSVNVLVLDVDETLRSTAGTDNEIPRETLHYLTEFNEAGVPIVICTGQTLENVKGFLIQGLGSEVFNSGTLSVVYEAGTGVFTPEQGADTKQLLYESLDDEITGVFYELRSNVLADAPPELVRDCHLQGNEFNVTLKPNFETGSPEAVAVIERALLHLVDLIGRDAGGEAGGPRAARRIFASRDPEIRAVLEARGALPTGGDAPDDPPPTIVDVLDRIEIGYYEGEAAEVRSLELNKVVGVEAALDVLGVADPFALVMGDSKSDRRVMEWAVEHGAGIVAAPEHASASVLDFVTRTDELVFQPGDASRVLRMVYAMNLLDALA